MDSSTTLPTPARSRRLRRVVMGLIIFATLTALFYAEEDWRWARAWEKYKQERIAAGEHFDMAWFLPKPVPDDQNFYKTPFLQANGYGRGLGSPSPQRELMISLSQVAGSLIAASPNKSGMKYDLKEGVAYLRGRKEAPGFGKREGLLTNLSPELAEPAADIVQVFGQFPEIKELREASRRPFSQADCATNFNDGPIPNFVVLRSLSQVFYVLSIANRAMGDTNRAVEDLHVMEQIVDALKGDPNLVAAMIRVAIGGLLEKGFWEGWADRQWSGPQLAEFQRWSQTVNFIADVDHALKGEERGRDQVVLAGGYAQMMAQWGGAPRRTPPIWCDPLMDWIRVVSYRIPPSGWEYASILVADRQSDLRYDCYDVQKMLFFPDRSAEREKQLSTFVSQWSPHSHLARISIPNYTRAFQTAARNQTLVNQAAVVCALERFRLAQGQYPDALGELVPKFMDAVPNDVIGGLPLKYRRESDSFVLYSVGLNGKDNGGKQADQNDDSLDWVWPQRP